jgi:PAS domain S-box-containing protein
MHEPSSSMISPENSEDGRLPHIADVGQQQQHQQQQQQFVFQQPQQGASHQLLALPGGAPVSSPVPLAPMAMHPAPHQQQHQQLYHPVTPGNSGTLHLHHDDPVTKRRRTDPSHALLVAATGPAPPVLPNGVIYHQPVEVAAVAAAAASSAVSAMGAAAAAAAQGRGRKKSQTQIDRRRERNRILARRTRLRKKFFFESLQKELMDLQRENYILKDVAKEHLDEGEAARLLAECDALEKLPPGVFEACGQNELVSEDFNLVSSIQKSQHSFVITDPSLPDNPIVFVSDDFLKVTGYTREQILGRNCRFLQGTDTSKEKVDTIRQALANGEDVSITLLNYTATGKPFWNKLFIASLRDAENNVVNFIGVIVPVAAPPASDPEHAKAKAMALKGSDDLDDSDDEDDMDDAESALKSIEGAVTAAVAASGAY